MVTFNKQLSKICESKNNRLCIGLDIDNRKLSNNTISYMDGFIRGIIVVGLIIVVLGGILFKKSFLNK